MAAQWWQKRTLSSSSSLHTGGSSPSASLISPVPVCSGGGDPHVLPGGLMEDGGHCVTAQWSSKHPGRATNEYKACLNLWTNVNTCSGWDIDGEMGTSRCLAQWVQTSMWCVLSFSYCRHCDYKCWISHQELSHQESSGFGILIFYLTTDEMITTENDVIWDGGYSFGKMALFITLVAEFFLSEWAKRVSWPIVCQGDELLD